MCIIHKSFRGFQGLSPASILGGKLIDLKHAIPYEIIHQTLTLIKIMNMINFTTRMTIVIAIAFLLTNCNNSGNNSDYDGASSSSYQEQKMSLEDKELANPTDFLDATGTYRENLLGDKLKVNGTITNSATVATYKDAVVRVTYYSKSKTNLGSEDYTIWDIFPSHSTKKFNLKIKNYSNISSIGWDVVKASSY